MKFAIKHLLARIASLRDGPCGSSRSRAAAGIRDAARFLARTANAPSDVAASAKNLALSYGVRGWSADAFTITFPSVPCTCQATQLGARIAAVTAPVASDLLAFDWSTTELAAGDALPTAGGAYSYSCTSAGCGAGRCAAQAGESNAALKDGGRVAQEGRTPSRPRARATLKTPTRLNRWRAGSADGPNPDPPARRRHHRQTNHRIQRDAHRRAFLK